MSKKSQRPKDDPEQSRRFIDAAKEAEADEPEVGAVAFSKDSQKQTLLEIDVIGDVGEQRGIYRHLSHSAHILRGTEFNPDSAALNEFSQLPSSRPNILPATC